MSDTTDTTDATDSNTIKKKKMIFVILTYCKSVLILTQL